MGGILNRGANLYHKAILQASSRLLPQSRYLPASCRIQYVRLLLSPSYVKTTLI